uniref:Uncharacterized protein n=1 Tax=viral metagenome TaxID=1070528 RepID=A0A6C0ERD7_9ZZZZ
MNILQKNPPVVFFTEHSIQNNIRGSHSIDNNLRAHLNPMRVHFEEEEKHDIESNEPYVVSNEENEVIVKHNIHCCTMKQLFEYAIVSCVTGVLLICIEYIIYVVKSTK